ncbi:MAG: hypothetical protein ABR927_18540 [Bacteroidales bacterium]|jgi:hypothetical protein
MKDSFYYFFSATPQVLGGILALFGVFVLFKIQSLSTEMTTVISELFHFLKNQYLRFNDDLRINKGGDLLNELERSIQSKNITNLKSAIDTYSELLNNNATIENNVRKFNALNLVYRELINDTIRASIFTAIIIILCLAVIPFETLIICNSIILYFLFIAVIISISLIFYTLISILKKALK